MVREPDEEDRRGRDDGRHREPPLRPRTSTSPRPPPCIAATSRRSRRRTRARPERAPRTKRRSRGARGSRRFRSRTGRPDRSGRAPPRRDTASRRRAREPLFRSRSRVSSVIGTSLRRGASGSLSPRRQVIAHRVHRQPQRGRDLLVRQPVANLERQALTLPRRQRLDRFPEGLDARSRLLCSDVPISLASAGSGIASSGSAAGGRRSKAVFRTFRATVKSHARSLSSSRTLPMP